MGPLSQDVSLRRKIQKFLKIGDKAIDVIIWLEHVVMLYLALAWLVPLFAAVLISVLWIDLRPLLRGHVDSLFLYAMIGFPLWFAVCLWAEFTAHPAAARFKDFKEQAPAWVGYMVLGLGGLFWLFGVF